MSVVFSIVTRWVLPCHLNLTKVLFILFFLVVVFPILNNTYPSSKVFASNVSPGSSITITAVVLPARYIIVDSNGIINKILSNTKQNVTPKVYLNSINGKELVLTNKISNQYTKILKKIKLKNLCGIIYNKPLYIQNNTSSFDVKLVSYLKSFITLTI